MKGKNMWYVIHTQTNKEQELLDVINLMISPNVYSRCFFIKREAIWRLQGEFILRTESLFPGYVIVDTDKPIEFYQQLKITPYYARILGREKGDFISVTEQEKAFVESLLLGCDDDTVRLSPVTLNGRGDIDKAGGALKQYKDLIIKKRVRLRYVIVRLSLFGKDRDVYMGIRLFGDAGETKQQFMKLLTSGGTAGKYKTAEELGAGKDEADEDNICLPDFVMIGVKIVVTDGPFESVTGIVTEIDEKKKMLAIEVSMFGRLQTVWIDWLTGMDVA